jgi:hypothetical protein
MLRVSTREAHRDQVVPHGVVSHALSNPPFHRGQQGFANAGVETPVQRGGPHQLPVAAGVEMLLLPLPAQDWCLEQAVRGCGVGGTPDHAFNIRDAPSVWLGGGNDPRRVGGWPQLG